MLDGSMMVLGSMVAVDQSRPKELNTYDLPLAGASSFARSVRGQKGQKYVEKTVSQTKAQAARIVGSALRKAGL